VVERIAVTGLGLISPLGHEPGRVADRLISGEEAVLSPSGYESPDLDEIRFGRVELDFPRLLGGTGWRHHTRSALMACLASQLLLADSKLELGAEIDPEQVGIALGLNHNVFVSSFHRALTNRDLKQINPPAFLNIPTNSTASQVSILLGLRAFAITLTTGFTAGLETINVAVQALLTDRAQAVLAGGVEEHVRELTQSFASSYQDHATSAATNILTWWQPGVVAAGEGCALLLLEKESGAQLRGSKPRAFISGFGMGFNAEALGNKNPKAVLTAVHSALSEANLFPGDIDAVFLAANGNCAQDMAEAEAMKEIFQNNIPPGVAIKGAWGETYHASGALTTAAAILCLERGIIPPTKNLASGPMVQVLNLKSEPREIHARHALIMAMDQDQKAAALIITLPNEEGN